MNANLQALNNVDPQSDYVVTMYAEDERFVLVTPSVKCNEYFHDGIVDSFLVETCLLGQWKSRMIAKMRTVRLA